MPIYSPLKLYKFIPPTIRVLSDFRKSVSAMILIFFSLILYSSLSLSLCLCLPISLSLLFNNHFLYALQIFNQIKKFFPPSIYKWITSCLEKEMATHSTVLAWKIPWTEDPGGLQSGGVTKSDRVEHRRVHLMFSSSTFIVNFLYLNILPIWNIS